MTKSQWKGIFMLSLVVAAWLTVSTMDYNDAVMMEKYNAEMQAGK